jgi:hypothetical protein
MISYDSYSCLVDVLLVLLKLLVLLIETRDTMLIAIVIFNNCVWIYFIRSLRLFRLYLISPRKVIWNILLGSVFRLQESDCTWNFPLLLEYVLLLLVGGSWCRLRTFFLSGLTSHSTPLLPIPNPIVGAMRNAVITPQNFVPISSKYFDFRTKIRNRSVRKRGKDQISGNNTYRSKLYSWRD